jgi:hypothetical protein
MSISFWSEFNVSKERRGREGDIGESGEVKR